MDGHATMTETQRLAEVERERQLLLQEARVPAMAQEYARHALQLRALSPIIDFDLKQGGLHYNRMSYFDETFDLDEESPHGPMRYTDRVSTDAHQYRPCRGVNIFAVKIASSDIGFPIHAYGTVIARDNIDERFLYLLRRDRNHCQLINSEDNSLILTGPKRGIALIDDDHVEIDLKVKDHGGQDKELSKGCIMIAGIARRRLEKCEVETKSLETRLSTVDVICAVVKYAVEGTIAIESFTGKFLWGYHCAHNQHREEPCAL